MKIECSKQSPWGVHLSLREDGHCPRCGWGDTDRHIEVAAAARRRMRDSWTLVARAA